MSKNLDSDSSLEFGVSKLKQKLLYTALALPEFRVELKEAASEIRNGAVNASNEATIESYFERILYALLKDIGFRFHPEKEVQVDYLRHIGWGRMDSRLGAVVIEYKHKSKLKTLKDLGIAINQLSEYLISVSENSNVPICGFLTDGLIVVELRAEQGVIVFQSTKADINEESLLRLVRSLLSLNSTALNAENLIRDFCINYDDGVIFNAARLLNSILDEKSSPKTNMLRAEWEELFRLAHEDQSQQLRIQERRKALSEIFKIDINEPAIEYQALFALHTAYAIVLKFIAYRVVCDLRFGAPLQDYRSLIQSDNSVLRPFCSDLEDGEIFRKLGILNLLEGDFFSWYCDEHQWNEQLAEAIRNILSILARYEDVANIFVSYQAVDLFRELFEATVPQAVRSSLGEFYTPHWLACHVLESTKPTKDWRMLDPCCGSGTFIIAAISRIRKECSVLTQEKLLEEILNRVVGVDLNPLAVLTTRIHYFIYISDLLPSEVNELVIPVFLGDASYIPETVIVQDIPCLTYKLRTLKNPIQLTLPQSVVKETPKFVKLMEEYENNILQKDALAATELLVKSINPDEQKEEVIANLEELSSQLVDLEIKGWNGIWARIITNFLTTACLGKFNVIIGNPPWIDWKNLPAGYREKIKSLCIDRGLFSGAGRTGGINLNICALIAHVAATNWLADNGVLAFLMPKELSNQASYEGWRRLRGTINRNFVEFHDWSRAGHPFDPVKEDFMTFVIGNTVSNDNYVKVYQYIKRQGDISKAKCWKDLDEAMLHLEVNEQLAGQVIPSSTIFTIAGNSLELEKFKLISGECSYIGREGIEFYPQELLIFEFYKAGPKPKTVFLQNIQVQKSKYKIPRQKVLLETKYLFPLVKGRSIKPFHHNYEGLIVPFPYEESDPQKPIDARKLKKESPLLLDYYNKFEEIIKAQTHFSDKIRGSNPGEFYGLARTGIYSFADIHVAFRDNSKWCATVVGSTKMPWNENKRFLFQNHAVSICEHTSGRFITEEEAHYIAAILNAPIVQQFIYLSSDSRSFKIRPPIYVPEYDPRNKHHNMLAKLSVQVHDDISKIPIILAKIEYEYLEICKKRI